MDASVVLSAAALILGLIVTAAGALLRFTVAQTEQRLGTVERRVELIGAVQAALETRLAVVASEHGGTTRALARIEAQLAQLTSKLLGRASTHEEE